MDVGNWGRSTPGCSCTLRFAEGCTKSTECKQTFRLSRCALLRSIFSSPHSSPAQSFISYPPLFASSFQLNVPAVFSVDPNAVMPRKMLFGLCFFHALIQEPDTIFMQSCIRIGRTPIRPNGCWSIFTFSSHRTARGWPPSSPLNEHLQVLSQARTPEPHSPPSFLAGGRPPPTRNRHQTPNEWHTVPIQ